MGDVLFLLTEPGKVERKSVRKVSRIWTSCVALLIHPHPWVQLESSKIIQSHLSELDPYTFKSKRGHSSQSFLTEVPGCLFDITRNLCYHQLNAIDETQIEIVSSLAIKNLAWSIRAMHARPNLCFKSQKNTLVGDDDDNHDNDKDNDNEGSNGSHRVISDSDPILSLITRLANIAKRPGSVRRDSVFK